MVLIACAATGCYRSFRGQETHERLYDTYVRNQYVRVSGSYIRIYDVTQNLELDDTADRDGRFRASCMIFAWIETVAEVKKSVSDSACFDPFPKARWY